VGQGRWNAGLRFVYTCNIVAQVLLTRNGDNVTIYQFLQHIFRTETGSDSGSEWKQWHYVGAEIWGYDTLSAMVANLVEADCVLLTDVDLAYSAPIRALVPNLQPMHWGDHARQLTQMVTAILASQWGYRYGLPNYSGAVALSDRTVWWSPRFLLKKSCRENLSLPIWTPTSSSHSAANAGLRFDCSWKASIWIRERWA